MPQGRRRLDTNRKPKTAKLTAKQAAKQRASTPVDKVVGTCVRERRIVLGWSQEELAEKLKISFQQVQKYEAGTNRIGASRLYQIARVLDTDVNHFYGTLPMPAQATGGKKTSQRVAPELREVANPITPTPKGKAQQNKGQQRAALALVRHYYKIQSPSVRRGLVQTVHAFSDQQGKSSATKKGAKKSTKKTAKKSAKKTTKKAAKKSARKKTTRKRR